MTGHILILLLLLILTLPTNGSSTVNCPSDAVAPTPPTVTDACGRAITPQLPRHLLLPVTVRWYIPLLMQIVQATLMTGPITYTIAAPDFTLRLMALQPLIARVDAVAPTPPAVTDACGRAITPTVTSPSPVTCNGTNGLYIYLCRLCRPYS
jgi:hypothetical protein